MIVHTTVILRSRVDVIVSVNASVGQTLRICGTRSRLTAAFLAAPGTLLHDTR
jgi:hypothetical protein